MQYFTFIGNADYKLCNYEFSGDKKSYQYNYVQGAILEKYQDDIDEVIVFCTEESREKHKTDLEKMIVEQFHKEVQFKEMDFNISSEGILKQLNEEIRDDFIFDITNSFRNIPVSVIMIIRYLEMATKHKLQHLYYGRLEGDSNSGTKKGDIMDMMKQYNDSLLFNDLDIFERTLRVNKKSLTRYGNDEKITKLLTIFERFNITLQCCEFDESIKQVQQIVERCQSVLNDKTEQYILIRPLLQSIVDNLKKCARNGNRTRTECKYNLIELLLEKGQLQIAITFTDQLIREEFSKVCFTPDQKEFDLYKVCKACNIQKKPEEKIYYISQYAKFKLVGHQRYNDKDNKTQNGGNRNQDKEFEKYYQIPKNKTLPGKEDFKRFYVDIRNKMNHGQIITFNDSNLDKEEYIKKTIKECLNDLKEFTK